MAGELPTGTVTFLLTDVEGSTRLWEQHPEAMGRALVAHDAIVEFLTEQHHGVVVRPRGEGDSRFCVFARATDALAAAAAIQRALGEEPWPTPAPLRVRAALHTGEAELREADYYGTAVNRCARLRGIAHGGQTLFSHATADLVDAGLPTGLGSRDLGLHRLRDLGQPEHVFELVGRGLPDGFPPPRSLDAHPNDLPPQVTSFVGRERELAEVEALLGRSRLLTLTGTGGCGKTRLALQAAADLLDGYPDGAWFVDLAPLADGGLASATALAAVGGRALPGQTADAALVDHLRGQHALLVLDNCEHLVGAAAALVETLLHGCPRLRLLATSRELLGVAGEAAWRVPSLGLPSEDEPASAAVAECDAVGLFVERARLAQPDFAVTAANAAAVAQLCRRLDGMPLALELAAARLRVLSVPQIVARLDDRFRLLTGGSRTALRRQQTLQAMVDWSHDLLAAPERALLRRLSVFAGGFSLEAAEAVGGFDPLGALDVLDVLTGLVDRSLVVADQSGEAARYRLLETIRQYAGQKLVEAGEAELARDRHAEWFAGLCEQARPAFRGPDQRAWLDRLELELDNLRAALAWAEASRDPARGLRLLGSSLWFWFLRYHRPEAAEWVERLLRLDGDVPPLVRAAALRTYCSCAVSPATLELRYRRTQESLALCRAAGDGPGECESLHTVSFVAGSLGRRDERRPLLDEAVALARKLADEPLLCLSLAMYGGQGLSDDDESLEAPLEEGRALAERLGDTLSAAMACRGLAAIARRRGDAARAAALYREDLARCRELGDTVGVFMGLANLGREHLALGEPERAGALFRETLAVLRAARAPVGTIHILAVEGLARVDAEPAPTRAARLLGAAEALRTRHWTRPVAPPPPDEALPAALRGRLGPAPFAAAFEAGLAMSAEQGIDDALGGEGVETRR